MKSNVWSPIIQGIAFVILLMSCSEANMRYARVAIKNELTSAGNNRLELLEVLNHYKNDSLKFKAAIFLIQNMDLKGYNKYSLTSSSGKKYNQDFFTMPYSQVLDVLQKFEQENRDSLFYINTGYSSDVEHITSKMLIEDIDYACKVWKLPWASQLSFDEFCEFLLPYRIDQEPLQQWRKHCYENNIDWVLDSMHGSGNALLLCKLINNKIKAEYSYRHKEISFFPGVLTLAQIEKFKGGRCEDLNMLAAYVMRSVGLPVACEYTPYWGNSNYGGHTWLSVFYKKHFIPFNSAYDNPSLDSLPFGKAHLAKAFRKTFRHQDEALSHVADKATYPIPQFFKSHELVDVTKEYLPTLNVSVPVKYRLSNFNLIFLGVLNGKFWKAIQCSKRSGDKARFQNMATHVLYMPVYNISGVSIPAGNPFLLNNNSQQVLVPDTLVKTKVSLKTNRINWLNDNEICHLVYWNGSDWISTGNFQHFNPRKKEIEFTNVPSNAIYRIIDDSAVIKQESKYGRPFLLDKEKNEIIDY